jgi:plastocyanin
MPVRRLRTLAAAPVAVRIGAALLGLVLAASLASCSNTSSAVNRQPHSGAATASTVNGIQQVTIDAGDDYRFHPSTITVHPGKVEVILHHTGTGAPHNFEVTSFPADFVPLTTSGETREATFVAPAPGRYQFVCTIHLRQGQTGTLVVLPN